MGSTRCLLFVDLEGYDGEQAASPDASDPAASEAGSVEGGSVDDASVDGQVVQGPAYGAPVVVATGQARPHWIVLDGAAAYWVNEGHLPQDGGLADATLMKVLRSGGDPAKLGSSFHGHLLAQTAAAVHFAFHPVNTECFSQISIVPKQGGPSNVFYTECVYALTSDGASVFSAGNDGYVSRDGSDPVTQVSRDVRLMTATASSVVFVDPKTAALRRAPKSGSAATTSTVLVPNQPSVLAIASDGPDVYWATPTAILRVAEGGGAPATVIATTGTALAMAVTSSRVVWTDSAGSVLTALKDGTSDVPETIATSAGLPLGVAADEDAVYWTDINSGTVSAARKR